MATINIEGKTNVREDEINTEIWLDLPLDCIHVHTHCGHFATAVLMKFVAARLTSEAIKEKLVTEITVGQLEEGFPYLQRRGCNECTCTATTKMITCLKQTQKKPNQNTGRQYVR